MAIALELLSITANGVSSGLIKPAVMKLQSLPSFEHCTSFDGMHLQRIDQTSALLTQETSRLPFTSLFAKPVHRSLLPKVTTIRELAIPVRTRTRSDTSTTAEQTGSKSKESGFTTLTHTTGRTKYTNDSRRKRLTIHTNLTKGAYPYGQHKIRKFTCRTPRRYVRKNVRKYLSRAKDW